MGVGAVVGSFDTLERMLKFASTSKPISLAEALAPGDPIPEKLFVKYGPPFNIIHPGDDVPLASLAGRITDALWRLLGRLLGSCNMFSHALI